MNGSRLVIQLKCAIGGSMELIRRIPERYEDWLCHSCTASRRAAGDDVVTAGAGLTVILPRGGWTVGGRVSGGGSEVDLAEIGGGTSGGREPLPGADEGGGDAIGGAGASSGGG